MELNVSPKVAWVLIILGGVFQVGWSIGLDYTEGMTNIVWDIIVLVSLLLSMLCLSIPMKSGISISTAYAVWVGLGVVLTIIVSAVLGLETITLGMVVFLDEGVVLYKIQSKVSRSNNYERLLSMFNDIMQGKSSHLSVYVCGTPEFIEDPDRGLYSYEALRSRLVSGRFENGYDNYLGPVVNLRPLTNEEVFVLLRTLRSMHEQLHGYESGIDDAMLETYLRTVNCSVGVGMVTPREITRDFISLLDTMHQNPDVSFSELVEGRTVSPDRDPADDLIGDLEV